MFSDTLTVTINGAAKVLTRINQDQYSSEYRLRETLGEYTLRLRNTAYTDKTRAIRVDRHNVELIHTLYPTGASSVATIRKAYFVFENDLTDTVVDPVKHGVGVCSFLSEANLTKMVNWES
jgi:ADP-ribosylglycohydrolase